MNSALKKHYLKDNVSYGKRFIAKSIAIAIMSLPGLGYGAAYYAGGSKAAADGGDVNTVGIGCNTSAAGSVAIGGSCVNSADATTASGRTSVAIGYAAKATGASGVAIGSGSTASGANSISLGSNATASTANSVALGYGSVTAAANAVSNVVIGGTTYNFAGNTPVGVVSVGSAGSEKQVTNVAAGGLSSTSTDAVNGSQLYATNQQVTKNTTDIATNASNIASNTDFMYQNSLDITANATKITSLSDSVSKGTIGVVQRTSTDNVTTLTASGGTASAPGDAQKLTNLAAGTLSATSKDAVNGSQLFATNEQVSANTADIATNTTNIAGNTANITNLTNSINSGSVGLVRQADDTAEVTVAASTGGTSVNVKGTAGNRKVTGVAAGTLSADSVDAVNGSQLFATNTQVSTNTTNIASNTSNISNLQTDVTNLGDSITNISSGTTGVVQRTSTDGTVTLTAKDGTGTNPGDAQKLTNLAAGTLSATSKDAVNGSQLFAMTDSVANLIGGNATINAATGAVTATNIGGTGYSTIDEAISSVKSSASAAKSTIAISDDEKNLSLTTTTNADGSLNYLMSLKSDVIFTSVNVGTVVMSSTTNTITGLSNTTWSGKTDTPSRAATEGQLAGLQNSLETAVNSAAETGLQYDKNADGTTNKGSVTLGGTNGTTVTNVTAGELSATSSDAVNGSQLYATNQKVTENASAINELTNSINNGGLGVVKQADSSADITVGASSGGTTVNMSGTAGNRKVTGVAAGSVNSTSSDAVNGSQLNATNQVLASSLGAARLLTAAVTLPHRLIQSVAIPITMSAIL